MKMGIVKAGVAVVVVKENKILIGKRKGSHGAGQWAFPGGHIEFGEIFQQTAEREVFEETSLEVYCEPFDHHGRFEICTTLDILTPESQYVTVYLKALYISGTLTNKEPNKCEEWKWTTLDEINEMIKNDEKAQVWIPINQIIAYRKELRL